MAPTDIKTAVHKVQELIRAVVDIETAPNEVQEDYIQFPFGVSFVSNPGTTAPVAGSAEVGGQKKELHTIFTEIHLNRGLFGEAIERALDMHPKIVDVLCKNPTLGATVDTIIYPIRHSFGRLDWGAQENVHIGWRYEIDVKLHTTIA